MYLIRWRSAPEYHGESLEFKYGPLRSFKTGIRLAQIRPGSGNKGVAIDLIDALVSGPLHVPYYALSYTWGSGERTKSISCNGKRLAVTQTLLEALRRFRDPWDTVTLWADQICICQDRIKERNQQVQLMGQIFKRAVKVIVWLGEDYDDSRAGMQLAKQLLSIARYQPVSGLSSTELESHGLPKRGHRRWNALSAILRRPWFWRTWVVQEVVLNPNVELVLGASMLTWDELEMVVTLLEGPMPRIWQLDQAISASELPFSRINRIRLRHQRLIATPVSPTQVTVSFDTQLYAEPEDTTPEDEGDDPELLDLLLMSRGLGATDPRDKIYGILSISPPLIANSIQPNYSLDPAEVYKAYTLSNIALTHRLDDLSLGSSTVPLPGLPSWAPDWSNPASEKRLWAVTQLPTGISAALARSVDANTLEVAGVCCGR